MTRRRTTRTAGPRDDARVRYELAFREAPVLVVLFDGTGTIVDCNEAGAAILGAPVEKVIGVNLPRESRVDGMVAALQAALGGEESSYEGEYTSVSGGRTFTARATFRPLRDDEDRVCGAVVVGEDVTALKRAEEELARWRDRLELLVAQRTGELAQANRNLRTEIAAREEAQRTAEERERLLRLILDHTEALIFLRDREGRYRMVNRGYAALFDRAPEDFVGRTVAEMLPEEDAARIAGHDREVLASGRATQFEEVLHLSGKTRTFLTIKALLELDARDGPVLCGISTDITGRKELEGRVRRAQKLESLGILAGGVAHDFNNLLCGMLGNAELALLEASPGTRTARHLTQLREAALRAAELCRQMLDYSGKGRFVVAPTDLSRVVGEMAGLLRSSIGRHVRLDLELAEGLPAVRGDATQLRQVALNLILNASEAIGERPGTVRVATSAGPCRGDELRSAHLDTELPPGTYVELEVTDDGVGMDEEARARLFEPFFTTKFTGRGLGLAAVLGIVRSHGGTVRVDSEPGEGARMRVLFPAADDPASDPGPAADDPTSDPRPAADDPAGAWRGAGTLLVVDDEAAARETAARMLEHLGFDVLTAADGREGLEVFRRHADRLRLVLLDLTMPGLSGTETLEALREVRADVPVLLASGHPEDAARQQLEDGVVAGFLAKPFRMAGLRAAVRAALG